MGRQKTLKPILNPDMKYVMLGSVAHC